ncbi:MAG TPA: cell division protein ZapE [Bauldia sp.]|nr:cell division protein ZapE [Bauldia sp.]
MTSGDASFAPGPVAAAYSAKIATGEIGEDSAQWRLVGRLDRLCADLAEPVRGGLFARLLGRTAASPRGLYIHGAVGRGKTMLMDAFFGAAPVERKRRIHFNEFMGEVQDRLHAARSGGASDPVAPVAAEVLRGARLLCLDEFAVTDIADAMILSRLFAALFADGLVLVATSNVPPEDLYSGGLNRGLFLPFVALLEQHCDIFRLDVDTDYRLAKLAGTPVYVTPLGAASDAALDAIWLSLTGTRRGEAAALRTRGRDIRIPQAVDGVARFGFADLCRAPLAANDYIQIARAFHTVVVDHIPIIGEEERDVARRFILLIDTLYDHGVNLVASAAAEPVALYLAGDGEEAAAFPRTVSRLIEMRSAAWLAGAHHGVTAANAIGA